MSVLCFTKKVIEDPDLFLELMLHTESKQKNPDDFCTGFLMGLLLASIYEKEKRE